MIRKGSFKVPRGLESIWRDILLVEGCHARVAMEMKRNGRLNRLNRLKVNKIPSSLVIYCDCYSNFTHGLLTLNPGG